MTKPKRSILRTLFIKWQWIESRYTADKIYFQRFAEQHYLNNQN